MNEHEPHPAGIRAPRGEFILWQAALCFAAAPLAGLLVARAAVWAEQIRAPLLIFPLAVGALLGLLLAGISRLAQFGHRPTLLAGAALAALATIAGQHYFSYRDYLNARAKFLAEKRDGDLAQLFPDAVRPPPNFIDYMRGQADVGRPITASLSLRGASVWASWTVEATLLAAAAIAMLYFFTATPYCRGCRSWYRAVRSGAIGIETAARLAVAASLPADEFAGTVHYRLSHCASGCGLARLELAWNDSAGRGQRAEAWLMAEPREQAVRVLDNF